MPPRAPRLSPNMRGGLWMLASVAGATGMTVWVRQLTPELHTAMIAFLRSVIGLVFVAPLLLRAQPVVVLGVTRPGLHIVRGALIAVALNAGFYAIWQMPVATATILFFLAPVFSTMLAPVMVGETVGPWRWGAVAAGFFGALIVVRPGAAPLDMATGAAVLSALCFALALLIGKTASRADGTDAVFATTAILSAAFTLPFALMAWRVPPEPWVWGLLCLLTCASALRGYADIRAMAVGEASFVAPVSYLRLPAVAALGLLMFGEAVDALTWLGGGVIAAATLVIALRERARPGPGPD